ncbi:MAG: dihydropteroate synthase, partial [Betaproteobacteria bacterium]|nr:dihydropteroate synthase [Betaproteobacteria bacterium]
MTLRCGRFALPLDRPLIMGVLNVTPDSFSDGGRFVEREAALAQARRMAAEGAAIIDVGGESSRPGAHTVSEDEELARVLPVLEALADLPVPVSVDTRRARVM